MIPAVPHVRLISIYFHIVFMPEGTTVAAVLVDAVSRAEGAPPGVHPADLLAQTMRGDHRISSAALSPVAITTRFSISSGTHSAPASATHYAVDDHDRRIDVGEDTAQFLGMQPCNRSGTHETADVAGMIHPYQSIEFGAIITTRSPLHTPAHGVRAQRDMARSRSSP